MNAERKQSVGVLVIYNLKDEDVRIDLDLQKFLGVEQKPAVGLNLVTRSTYINLKFSLQLFHLSRFDGENGKSPQQRTFSIQGSAYERVDYVASPHHVLRAVVDCGDKHFA